MLMHGSMMSESPRSSSVEDEGLARRGGTGWGKDPLAQCFGDDRDRGSMQVDGQRCVLQLQGLHTMATSQTLQAGGRVVKVQPFS